jgi:SAM-dependent methyltransferase
MIHQPAAGQTWSADDYAANAGFVPALGEDVLVSLAPQPGETILDIGCGDGVLTHRIAEAGAQVTGLEPDPSLAGRARKHGLNILEQDAHDSFGDHTYDAIFSNAALHWMRRPEVVLANAYRALRPGGRFVAEQGGFGNVAAILTALNASLEAVGYPEAAGNPWDFPTPAAQTARLEASGFRVESAYLIARPTPLPTGFAGWLATFGAPLMGNLPEEAQRTVIADCARRLFHLTDETGTNIADYVRLRFNAVKPG